MNDLQFQAALAAARPQHTLNDAVFTDNVMNAIRSSEIFTAQIRNMSVNKKETLFMKLKHLPKLAIVAIAIGSLVVFSSGAYAAYQLLWPKSEVTVSEPTSSENGRKEVSLSFAECGDARMADRYELKKNATITQDQITGVVRAQCEMQAIDTWAQATFPHDDKAPQQTAGVPYDSVRVTTSMATHIKSSDAGTITMAGLKKYGDQPDTKFVLTDTTRYIVGGMDASADAINENDPIVYVTRDTIRMIPAADCTAENCSASSTERKQDLLAVIKLSLPFDNYDQFAWQSLTEKLVCTGNENDTCLSGMIGSIDLYDNYSQPLSEGTHKEIQGVIKNINGSTFTITGSSGTDFTFTMNRDVITDFNTNRSAGYNDQKVQAGSSLRVRYYEPENQHSKSLGVKSISEVDFLLEMVGKADAPNAY